MSLRLSGLTNTRLKTTLQLLTRNCRHFMKPTRSFIALAVMLGACSKEVPPPVKTERPALTQIAGEQAGNGVRIYSGEVRARHELDMGFRLNGKVVERPVEAGTRVRAGQVLARIDPADANLQAGASAAQWQLAETELKRFRDLHSKGFVSQSVLDAKEAALKVAAAQEGLTRNQAEYTTLRAGGDGVVVNTLVEVGQVVGAGQPVLRLAQQGEMEVQIAIPETHLAQHKVGEAAEITLHAEGGRVLSGRLRELSPSADPVSRTFAARVALSSGQAVTLGMTAYVRFNRQSGGELLIPVSAIYQQGAQTAVWIVASDRSISLRPVQVSAYRELGAVIAGGLQAGERFVSAGVHRLSAGEKIHIIEQVTTGSAR